MLHKLDKFIADNLNGVLLASKINNGPSAISRKWHECSVQDQPLVDERTAGRDLGRPLTDGY